MSSRKKCRDWCRRSADADRCGLVSACGACCGGVVESRRLVDQLFTTVRVPPAVEAELLVPGKPHTLVLKEFLGGKVLPVTLSQFVIVAPGLGTGEMEAMALYKALSADQLLIDDERARKVARLNQIQVVGSMGVLLLAKHKGLIPAVKPLIESMQSAGIHLSARLVLDALRLAGE